MTDLEIVRAHLRAAERVRDEAKTDPLRWGMANGIVDAINAIVKEIEESK